MTEAGRRAASDTGPDHRPPRPNFRPWLGPNRPTYLEKTHFVSVWGNRWNSSYKCIFASYYTVEYPLSSISNELSG